MDLKVRSFVSSFLLSFYASGRIRAHPERPYVHPSKKSPVLPEISATNPPLPPDFVSENLLPFPEFLHRIDIHVIRPHCQVRGALTVVYIYRNVRFGLALGSTHCYVPSLPLFSVKERE